MTDTGRKTDIADPSTFRSTSPANEALIGSLNRGPVMGRGPDAVRDTGRKVVGAATGVVPIKENHR